MKNFILRASSLLLLIIILCSSCIMLFSCSVGGENGTYTYKTYTSALGTNWNPHTWEMNADEQIIGYILSPLVDISIKDSQNGIYCWVFEMAESITDVTKGHKDDLTKYNVTLKSGSSADNTEGGHVFEIKLRQGAAWENGESITADDYIYSMKQLLDPKMKNYRANLYCEGESAIAGASAYYEGGGNFDEVGLYRVDDYTIRYVTQNHIDYNYFLTSCTSSWLVYKDLYESGKKTVGELTVTDYGTSPETTMSCGPYRLSSLQPAKQMVFEQNEKWYGYTEEDGRLISYTSFEVDGERTRQYQTTKIIIDVLDEQSAKQAFLKGQLTEWTPSADDLSTYSASDRLYKIPQTYTMSLFFNTNQNVLKKLDIQTNKNSIVISNKSFRQALSLCIDRNKFVSATQNYTPEYAILSNLYFYDIYNDPSSVYRKSKDAMQQICALYNISWGEGEEYATLEQAYASITGYNLTMAQALMRTACDELVSAGLYTRGSDITIRIAWAKGALSADDNKQISLLNEFVNAATANSGFGKITIEGVGNIENRYAAVPEGEYAIGYGAWGGAAFYPFRNFQVYMDPDQYSINEAGCYDPRTEKLTLTVNGESVTKTWQDWSLSMTGSGVYSSADTEVKLSILSQLERAFLQTYYRIPLCSTTNCSMLSYQCDYYTESYNVMYDFGGLRLLKYNYDDASWSKYVKKQNNNIQYE